jgi:lysyl-tRNA synthetase class 2
MTRSRLSAGVKPLLRLERHPQGPRVFVLGRRVHECALGLAAAAALLTGLLSGLLHDSLAVGAAAVLAAWLVAKDWRDLFPSKRDTAYWRVGLHRRVAALRIARRSEGLPLAAGLATFALAIVNVVSALTPSVHWRAHLLLHVEPVAAVPLFHALALPGGAALAVVAFYLQRRRRRAVHAAVAILAALGAFDLLKGLDFEEAALSWGLALVLCWGRDAFHVGHEPLDRRSPFWRSVLLTLGATGIAAVAVRVAAPAGAGPLQVARETVALLLWSGGPMRLGDDFGWLPLGIGLLGLSAFLGNAFLLFRPLAVPGLRVDRDGRRAALALVRAHGRDTLSFFKLRRDAHHFFAADGSAFLAYRTENGVLLVSGDPVGPAEALPGLLRELCAFAELRGLRIGVLGAARGLLPVYRDAGLRSFYIGDEAIVDGRAFSLEGRAIRKVRQSVNRLQAAGFSASVCRLDELDEAARLSLERVSALWRAGKPERGFAMAMDSLGGEHQADSLVVTAHDGAGEIRGFLHFVPTYGRPAMSLSYMRRDPRTPNGLTEFMVARGIELLRERGTEEISLNFAAFARLLHSPGACGRCERALGRLVALANPFFQIESLYRFNAKFSPRWEPRYLLYEGALGLPRVGLAAMRAEGQVPELRLRRLPEAAPATA